MAYLKEDLGVQPCYQRSLRKPQNYKKMYLDWRKLDRKAISFGSAPLPKSVIRYGARMHLIIGKIVQFHVENEIYESGRINPRGLAAVSRLAGNDYAKIGEIFTIERPK